MLRSSSPGFPLLLALLLTACGDAPAPKPTVPAWAKVAPEQIAGGGAMGMAWPDPDLKTAHSHSIRNRGEIGRSASCGCFYCYATYAPTDIQEWALDWVDGGPPRCRDLKPVTAICPRCGVDSVLGDACGYPVTDPAFLRAMHAHWF